MIYVLVNIIFSLCLVNVQGDPFLLTETSRSDGWYNNLDHPEWGSPGSPQTRSTSSRFEDGIKTPVSEGIPDPFTVSDLMRGSSSTVSSQNTSVFFVFLGQHIGDDMLDSRRYGCPNEYVNIEIPKTGNYSNLRDHERILPVYRSRATENSGFSSRAPRTLSNEATSWLDASSIYGVSNAMTSALRSHVRGMLESNLDSRESFPAFNEREMPMYNPTVGETRPPKRRNSNELFGFGNARGNENPFLITVSTIWFRWHNVLAERFASENPDWTDEKIFIRTRQYVMATYQKIVFYDWLPQLIGENPLPYEGYNEFLEPSISMEFSIAAMRIGHSQVPSGVMLRRTSDCRPINPIPEGWGRSTGEPALRLCETYWNMQEALVENGVDNIALGMLSQKADEIDNVVVEDLLDFSYGPLKRTRTSLEAITIQRGRDAGLATYNEARRAYGLPVHQNFSQINPSMDEQLLAKVSRMYDNDISKLDLYVGGVLESESGSIGELFRRIISQQFHRTRDSDRFWFENRRIEWFEDSDVDRIRNTTMADIIRETTSINSDLIQDNVFSTTGTQCRVIIINSGNFSKPCTPNVGIDFFSHQWPAYIGVIVLILSFFPICMMVMRKIAANNIEKNSKKKKNIVRRVSKILMKTNSGDLKERRDSVEAVEIEGSQKTRRVNLKFESGFIKVLSENFFEFRKISVVNFKKVIGFLSQGKQQNYFVIRVPKEYDIVLQFPSVNDRKLAVKSLLKFLRLHSVELDVYEMPEKALLSNVVTKEKRQTILETFFLQVFAKVLKLDSEEQAVFESKHTERTMEIISTVRLTQAELAESLGMKDNSSFVKLMFEFADKNNSGYLSFKEFTDLVIILMKGSAEDKIKLLFSMYDVDKSGKISKEEGTGMIKSFMETAGASVTKREIDMAVDSIFEDAGDDDEISLEQFTRAMLKDNRSTFESAKLSLPGVANKLRNRINSSENKYRRKSIIPGRSIKVDTSKLKLFSEATREKEESNIIKRKWKRLKRNVENYRRHIICMVVFYGVTIAVVLERAMFYAFGTEHSGIRRVSEWGIIISRATAAGISFHFSFILLTMSRNLITFFRETILNNVIPFDSAIAFHKQIAYVAGVQAALHAFGHLANFYHFSVHPLPVLSCLFPKILSDDGSDLPMSLAWWVFGTVPGFTGVLLLLTISIIYVFAMQYSRRFCFRVFWITHRLFSVLFVLLILHGSMGLIQEPVFHWYLSVPILIFILDTFVTFKRSKLEIEVEKADLLPSGVTNLVFTRPNGFNYHSGQWVRIASPVLATNEYHPFTLTSAPHEKTLSLHIRSVGPWTNNLRRLYQKSQEENKPLPNLYLDGPFGEGHQDWYKYKVSILVGAGIGVTPFASILKDIVEKKNSGQKGQIICEQVYFVWMTRTQKNFEWMTNIIKDVENSKGGDLVTTHIYITQFFNKFDLRTSMLYICEQYFQKCSNKSMFTGLKATTHFGRPQFEPFFNSIQQLHSNVRTIGVFSCGPLGMTKGVEGACRNLNKLNKARFNHFYENF